MKQQQRTRTSASLRAAALGFTQDGDHELADLLWAIAAAHDRYRKQDTPDIDEALRWSPVVGAALKIARGIS